MNEKKKTNKNEKRANEGSEEKKYMYINYELLN
jgi:hypothetical protein